jgi:hypothetical protein
MILHKLKEVPNKFQFTLEEKIEINALILAI